MHATKSGVTHFTYQDETSCFEGVKQLLSYLPGSYLEKPPVKELADELAYQMGQGKSVKLDGIGTFVPSLALRIDKERETGEADSTRRNARSIVVGSINFRAEKSLIHNTNYNCDLERSQQKFRRSSQKYTPEERLERAKQYLTGHPYMTVRNYVQLTGLRPTTASVELRKWAENPESGITTSGRGTHKVYIQR